MTASVLRSLPLPPGARGYPIIGEIGEWPRAPLLFAQDRHARYGPVWQMRIVMSHLLRTVRFELLPNQDFSCWSCLIPCVPFFRPAGRKNGTQ
jgi:hypothetical protein